MTPGLETSGTSDPGPTRPPRVIAGIDGSAHSAAALAWAAADAWLRGWDLVLVTACGHDAPQPGRGRRPAAAARERDCREMQDRLLGGLPADRTPPVSAQVRYGDPVEVLVRAASAEDVLVVGMSGHGRLRGLLLGSIPRGCAELALCPVVVVPSTPRGTAAPDGDRPVVAGVDASPEARAALRFAAEETMLRSAELVPVHAVYPDYTTGQADSLTGLPGDDALLPPLESAWAQLNALVHAELAGHDVTAEPVTIRGDPATVLLRWTQSAALVAVGARGAGRLHAALLGSVTTRLLRHSQCPIAVIPASVPGQAAPR